MFDEDGFVYKRLSIGKDSVASVEVKRPLETRADESSSSFFNFKFVKPRDKKKEPIAPGLERIEKGVVPWSIPGGRTSDTKGDAVMNKNVVARPKSTLRRKSVVFDKSTAMRDPFQLHTLLSPGDTFNTLVDLSVDFLKRKLGDLAFIDRLKTDIDVSKIDIREDLKKLDAEIVEIDMEVEKWEDVFEATMVSNIVSVDFAFSDFKVDEAKVRGDKIDAIREEFRDKESQLVYGLRKLEKVVENAESECEDLFKNILKTIEKGSGYDSIVLLRAMSKMGEKDLPSV